MRTYSDACGITRALDVIGERWALPVVRELIFGPRRYSDLATALPGVSTNILGSRLKELVGAGVIYKRRLGPPAAATVYELTPWGAGLEPILISLGRWAAHTPVDLEEQSFSASSFALSLRTTFDSQAARDSELHLTFLMGEDVFEARVARGVFTIARHEEHPGLSAHSRVSTDSSPTRVHSDPKTLAAIVYAGLDPAEASRDARVRIDGSTASVTDFARCFTLPPPPMEGPA
jgi:DNA-binding HxlR family transcriptional regulator